MNLQAQLDQFRKLRGTPPFNLRFHGPEDLVLRWGRTFMPGEPRYKAQPRECFSRSYALAGRRGSQLIYIEGFAVNSCMGFATPHAWLAHAEEFEIAREVAWAAGDGLEYFGIPFRFEYVKRVFEASGKKTYGVIDAWWLRWPLLTGEHRIEDAKWECGY